MLRMLHRQFPRSRLRIPVRIFTTPPSTRSFSRPRFCTHSSRPLKFCRSTIPLRAFERSALRRRRWRLRFDATVHSLAPAGLRQDDDQCSPWPPSVQTCACNQRSHAPGVRDVFEFRDRTRPTNYMCSRTHTLTHLHTPRSLHSVDPLSARHVNPTPSERYGADTK